MTCVLLMGMVVMIGWWTHSDLIVRVLPGHSAMRFNTALSFAVAGIAWLVRYRAVKTGLTVALGVLSIGTLLEYLLVRDLGIDELFAHPWEPELGSARMAPQTALCFLLVALALLLRELDRKWCRTVTRCVAAVIAMVGAIGLLGYVLGFEVFYSLYDYTPMALHTAGAMLLLGIGMLASLRNGRLLKQSRFAPEGFRVNLVVAVVVVGMAFAAGSAGFVVIGQELQNSAKQSMAQILRGNQQLLEQEFARRRDDLQRLATRPILLDGLRVLNGQSRDADAAARLDAMFRTLQTRPIAATRASSADDAIDALLAIEIVAADGQHALRVGEFTASPKIRLPMDNSLTLLWAGASTLYLQTDLFSGSQRLGVLKLEYRFDLLDRVIATTDAISATGDLRVCSAIDAAHMQCMPTRLAPTVAMNASRYSGAQPLAMHYALLGQTGTMEYRNARNVEVIGSYTSIGGSQVGLELARDIADLYSPLRTRLYVLIAVIAAIAALGIGLLRLRVTPLVRGLEAARLESDANATQLLSIMQTVPDGIFTVDAHGTMLSVNPALVRMFGYTEHELVGAPCASLLPELAAGDLTVYSGWLQSFRALTAGVSVFDGIDPGFDPTATGVHNVSENGDELVARHKLGYAFTVQLGLAALTLDGHAAFVGVVSDITERVRDRAKLKEAFDLLQSTVNSVTMGIAVFGANNALRIWNKQFGALSGMSASRLCARATLDDVIRHGAMFTSLEDRADATLAVLFAGVGKGRAVQAEFRRNDGRIMEIALHPMPDVGYVLTYNDITALAEAEFKHRDQATRLATTLDSIADAIVTINESGTIESWSKGAERVLGYRAEEVLGRNVNMLMPQPHAMAHDSYLRRYSHTRVPHVIGQRRAMEALHKDGHHVPVSLSISEMVIGGHRLFVGVLTDISAQLEMDRIKSGFVAAVSHELRTPLTSIAGSLGLLAGGVSGDIPEKAQRLVAIAKNNCDRLVRLINDILDIEKADSGKLEFKLTVQPLIPILERVVEAMNAYAASCGVRIELQDGLAPTVMVDTDRLIQVMTNLLSNAAKFSPRDAVVTVSVAVTEDSIRINVRDSGTGIPKEFQSRIFEKFAQADHSDARASGTGLGLAISKSIVERMSGAIGFDTQAGNGTTFYVDLPNYAPIDDQLLAQSSVLRNVAVLVCEDEREVGLMLQTTLLREGAHPVVVRNAKDARRELAACKYDLFITDINLPDGSGMDVIRELRARASTHLLPVIVASASSRAQHAPELIAALHIADWIRKPIVPARLLQVARQALAKQPQAATSLPLNDTDWHAGHAS